MAVNVSSLVGTPPLLFKIECGQGQVTDLPEYRYLGDKFHRLVVVLRELSKGNASAQDAYAYSCELKQIMDDPMFRQLVKGESNPKILLEHFDEEVRKTWKDLRDRARELTPNALNTLRLAAERERTGPRRLAVSLSPSPAPASEVHDGRARKRAVSLSDDDEETTGDNDSESDDEPLAKRTRSANNTRPKPISAPAKSAQRRDVPRPTVSVSVPRRNTVVFASSTPGSSSHSGSTSSSKRPSAPKTFTALPSAKIRSKMPRTKHYQLLKKFIDYVEQDTPVSVLLCCFELHSLSVPCLPLSTADSPCTDAITFSVTLAQKLGTVPGKNVYGQYDLALAVSGARQAMIHVLIPQMPQDEVDLAEG
ncbi:hypothetical protein CYLTODRAFT_454105 [Cylindrobasidium torrendii FP15055 ss-10]|uniref:Uncharacterized protein n=1 Tax=Cylindrobasidium torrendii FP15055 ss-10 TaxID=1314674 RepID=A0A0D7BBB1_9AGAR|nr:hypothetical protein CYLTODRAFT_454105 [Cylindrobasidium torrendii FP15055 ss-10]